MNKVNRFNFYIMGAAHNQQSEKSLLQASNLSLFYHRQYGTVSYNKKVPPYIGRDHPCYHLNSQQIHTCCLYWYTIQQYTDKNMPLTCIVMFIPDIITNINRHSLLGTTLSYKSSSIPFSMQLKEVFIISLP